MNDFKIYYIAELNLPSKSAYSIHVMKMCEAFSKLKYKVKLFVINGKNKSKIKNYYNIKSNFYIYSIFNSLKVLNFFTRIIFSYKILSKQNDKDSIYISRSIIFALLATISRKKTILELHHEITGLSKILYIILKNLNLLENLNYIFLSQRLNQIYKIKKQRFIVLDDAVNLDDFKIKKKVKYRNTCIYIGSFFEGKGIEQIYRLAENNPKIFFHIYGEKKFLTFRNYLKNLKIFDHISYNKIPTILSNYEIALMPYQIKIKGRGSINLEKYMSPLKMFDYLAAQLVIIASDLEIYKHILKDNFNCKLVKVNDDSSWSKNINNLFKNKKRKKYLRQNAAKTALKYTWEKRCKKIINYFSIKNLNN